MIGGSLIVLALVVFLVGPAFFLDYLERRRR
jgi:hypothetical protein